MKHYLEKVGTDITTAAALAPAVRMSAGFGIYPVVVFTDELKSLSKKEYAERFKLADITGNFIGFNEDFDFVYKEIKDAFDKNPDIKALAIENVGTFVLGESKEDADYAKSCLLSKAAYTVIPEKCCTRCGRLAGKIAIVTGSAQGFGEGIALEMVSEGAYMVIADLNEELAGKVAGRINEQFGNGTAIAIKVNVSDEISVREMVENTVTAFGGLDILVSNAGVLKAGGLEEMTLQNFEFVTKINYTAYFLCVKYASRPMKIQASVNPDYWSDIIQINSKSGLEGSNKNFAYAGGKFGGIGLTQSFAMELVTDNIKVNTICPGNFYEGPLWSDPVNGLFVQYLHAGKVPGAKTMEDVKAFYLAKSPIRRGCSPKDVTVAIYYCVEQLYETGQAIPVTGGQKMLK
ncbi:MAG: SDR family NAD(P)-dependent oxidoreductase [Saccharofermentanales bacterium]